jgi:hypothetical protein
MLGKAQWNKEGIKYYQRAEMKYKELYKKYKMMNIIYRGWESWLVTHKTKVIVGESSRKTFHSIMATWIETEEDNASDEGGKKGGLRNDSDSEDDRVEDIGYFSDKGTNKYSLTSRNSTATYEDEEESEMGEDDLVTGGGKTKDDSVTGGGKTKGKTLMEGDTSPARHTRAATNKDRIMGEDDAVTGGRKTEGKTLMEGNTSPARHTRGRKRESN